jgi:adsorption protein B
VVTDWAPFWLIDLLPDALLGLETGGLMRGLTAFVAVAILLSGLDDLFIDLCYYGALARSALSPERRRPQVREAELEALPEKRVAVMIPAWREEAVIGRMLRNTLRSVRYGAFELLVGVYPNDPATRAAVEEVAAGDARVRLVPVPHDGPTNKADCLNAIAAAALASGRGFELLVLHDSEDIVHPLSFKLMNRFVAEADMVQLPVVPFEAPASEWTAGTYLDEFAESHLKDMTVRERLSGMVPSAGVGTALSRSIVEELSRRHRGRPFNVRTFTEDYDLAFRLRAAGGRSILVQHFCARGEAPGAPRELVCTREYFPDRFADAVRQKARWTLGIVFHGWQQRGWEGGPALRYMVWRDRKTLMTSSVNMAGYALLLLHAAAGGAAPGPEGWVRDVILADGALLANRCLQRAVTIARVSSWRQVALSVPRTVWGNVINFFAVAKATRLFVLGALTGRPPAWAKTEHVFPSEEQLRGLPRPGPAPEASPERRDELTRPAWAARAPRA